MTRKMDSISVKDLREWRIDTLKLLTNYGKEVGEPVEALYWGRKVLDYFENFVYIKSHKIEK